MPELMENLYNVTSKVINRLYSGNPNQIRDEYKIFQ